MKLRVGVNVRDLVDPHMRGFARYTTNLLKALSRRGDVDLVLLSDVAPASVHLREVTARVEVVPSRRETFWEAWALPRALRRLEVDVFHAPCDRGLPIVKPCPCVLTMHNSLERAHWRSRFATVRRRYWYWKNELVNRANADAVITVSNTTRGELLAMHVTTDSRLATVHLAAGPEFVAGAFAGDAVVLGNHGIAEPYVLYVGAYDPHKNLDRLVRAFDLSELARHQLVVVARKGADFDRLQQAWRSLPSFPRMRLIEAADADLPAIYRRAQFFVNPSLWESFSFQLLEAMACGTPVATSHRGALPEIAGDAAVLFDPEDVEGLARAMQALAGDPTLRASLGAKGLARAAQFSWERVADETVRIYKRVARRSLQM